MIEKVRDSKFSIWNNQLWRKLLCYELIMASAYHFNKNKQIHMCMVAHFPCFVQTLQ